MGGTTHEHNFGGKEPDPGDGVLTGRFVRSAVVDLVQVSGGCVSVPGCLLPVGGRTPKVAGLLTRLGSPVTCAGRHIASKGSM